MISETGPDSWTPAEYSAKKSTKVDQCAAIKFYLYIARFPSRLFRLGNGTVAGNVKLLTALIFRDKTRTIQRHA